MKHQKGQSLVILLGFTAALVGSMILVFNTGQVTAEKERLVNAADAAAYSGAIWEARALNFQSYMNRAIVANEVAIAQSVSLRSWTEYVRSTLNNINLVTRFIPYLGAVTNAMAQASTSMNNASQTVLGPAEGAISLVNTALSEAQTAVHLQAVIAARSIALETLRANDPENRTTRANAAFVARNGLAWSNFTREFSGNERARLKDVVLRSRDGFTARRNFRLDAVVVRFEKRGGTDLVGFDTWRGVDTMSLHTPDLLLRFDETTPIGFGAAQNGPGRAQRGDNGGSFRANPRASRFALAGIRRASGYRGLQTTRDIADPQRAEDLGVDFVVEAQRNDTFAISTAQIYFQRPAGRADGRREFPSLYNPYWQVRLAPSSRSNRITAAAAKGLRDPYVAIE